MPPFEVMTADRKLHVWEGKDGLDACQRFTDAHRDAVVIAWRHYPRVGLFIGMREIIEPDNWRYGR